MKRVVHARTQRILAVVVLGLGLGYVGLSYWAFLHAGWSGLSVTPPPASEITNVAAGSAAARFGIVPRDRLNLAHMPVASRYYQLGTLPLAGTPLTMAVVHRGAERTVRFAAQHFPSDPISPWKRAIAAVLLLLSGILLLLRPQRATWAFMAYAVITTVSLCNQYLPYPAALGVFAIQRLSSPLAVVALLYFAIWFLHGEERPWHKPLANSVLTLGLAYSAVNLLAVFTLLDLRPLRLPGALPKLWEVGLSMITLLVLIEAYVTGRRVARQKIAWVVSALAFALIFYDIVPNFFDISFTADKTLVFFLLYALWSISPLLVAGALLYAMTQYRVVNVRFALSRALVYGLTTGLIVGIFAFVEWASGRMFEGTNVAAYAGLFAAILIGFAANSLHRRVDHLVDSTFFRRQYLAADRLRHVAASLLHTDAEPTIVKFLVQEPARVLDLASSALFLAAGDDASLTRTGSLGWSESHLRSIERIDEIIPQLRAGTAPLVLEDLHWHSSDLPDGVAAPLVAIPLKARGDLFGVVFYGAHTDGSALNSEERELLALLALNAASAYDHIEATRARAEIADLRLRLQMASGS